MKTILGIDIGYGDVKVTLGDFGGKILKQFKFPSVIGVTTKNDFIKDTRIFEFKDTCYYIGESALKLPSDLQIDITEYKNLEFYAPLFLFYAIKQCDTVPDIVVTGLSKAQIQNSGYFKENLQEFTINNETLRFSDIYVLPQGAGSKLCIDKYGDQFPKLQETFLGETSFVGIDIGFNTLDLFLVTLGKTSPALFEGIEKEGVMRIASKIAEKIKADFDRNITLHEAKDILQKSQFTLRGKTYDLSDVVLKLKQDYLKSLLELVEKKYGKILDKCDFISLTGGGSTIFETSEDGFIRVPKTKHEFYNSIGFYLFGVTKC